MMFYRPLLKDTSLSGKSTYSMKHVSREGKKQTKTDEKREKRERAKRVFIKLYSYYYTAAFSAHPLRTYTPV